MKDLITLLSIAIIGWFGGITLSQINQFLEMIVLILTISGLIYKILKIKSYGKETNRKEKRD